MATKRQIARLEKKLSFRSGGVYIFNEKEDSLTDRDGKTISEDKLKELKKQQNTVIIIDDI